VQSLLQHEETVDVALARNISWRQSRSDQAGADLIKDLPESASGVSDFDLLSFIATRVQSYDMVLIDTCAFTAVSRESFHPAIVAGGVEGALVVLSPQGMKRPALSAFKARLTYEQIEPLGFVVNVGGA
jgi:Mrp family chromosome partitioning ATPase